eukprot:4619684-Amphidinium_carterae.1
MRNTPIRTPCVRTDRFMQSSSSLTSSHGQQEMSGDKQYDCDHCKCKVSGSFAPAYINLNPIDPCQSAGCHNICTLCICGHRVLLGQVRLMMIGAGTRRPSQVDNEVSEPFPVMNKTDDHGPDHSNNLILRCLVLVRTG